LGQHKDLLERILSGEADANIPFEQLCSLLKAMGFLERVQNGATRRAFVIESVAEAFLVVQGTEGEMTKPYWVERVREFLVQYRIRL
jgi:hypothetical protein